MTVWLSGLAVIAAVVAASLAGMLLVRRSVGLSVLESHNEVAGFVYAVVGVIYAVLIAFVVIAVWEQYQTAEARVEQEANELADLFRDSGAFADPARTDVQGRIRAYRIAVIDEWSAMAQGGSSPAALEAASALWGAYREIKPQNAYESAWYAESLKRLNNLGDDRRLRLLSSHASVPGVIWTLLLMGGAITIAFTYFFGTRNSVAQALMVVALATMIGLVLFLISALNHPFSGVIRVGPEAFKQFDAVFGR